MQSFTNGLAYFVPIFPIIVTHFSSIIHFYTLENVRKTFGFVTFSGGIEMEHLSRMCQCFSLFYCNCYRTLFLISLFDWRATLAHC